MLRISVLILAALTVAACTQNPPAPEARATDRLPEVTVTGVTHLPPAPPVAPAEPLPPAEPVMAQPTDLWVRLRDGFQLGDEYHPRAKAHLDWYSRNPRYIDRVFTRADPYLYHILDRIEFREMPSEIALLPVVESAFDPFAYSHGRAAGLWQFIPGTGKRFGLKQNWWYDGRRDVFASTDAALDYLAYLHRKFDGDWMLALAAYNSGEGTVMKAQRRNRKKGKPTDFWNLDLPKETRSYVPKLLALSRLVNNPRRYGIELKPIANQPRIAQVDTGGQLDLAIAAKLAEISLDELYRLNPGFNRWATDPKGPHELVVPVDQKELFEQALADLPPDQRVQWVRHKIKTGETLSHIAKHYNTTVKVLTDTNGVNGHSIRAGKYLLVPVATRKLDNYALSAEQRQARIQNRDRGGVKITHKVKSGDTLWDIARHHKVSVGRLASWNSMAPGDTLRQGQKLVVWTREGSARGGHPGTKARPVHYTVRKGDSLDRISRRFKVRVNDVCRWNGLARNDYLQPGQRLKLYVDVTRQAEG